MHTEPYQKAIRKRKVWIEPLFAEGKLWHGMRRFRMRTLEKVNTEALMMATGQNIKRLLAFGRRGPEKLAQAVALRPPVRLRLDIARRRFRDHRRERRVNPTRFSTRWIVFGTTLLELWKSTFPRRVFILVLLDLFMHHHNTCVGGIGRRYWRGRG